MTARATKQPPPRQRRNTNPAPVPKAAKAPVIGLPRLYTLDELAEIFHCSPRTVRRMWERGELKSVKGGGSVHGRSQRYTRAVDLDAFLERAG